MTRLFKVWAKEPITLYSSRIYSPPAGLEPAIFGVEVRRLIHYAKGAWRVVAAASNVLAALEVSINKLCIKLSALFDLCLSSLRRGHANLLCIVAVLTDDPRRESGGAMFLPAGQQATVRSSELQSLVRLWQDKCLPAFTYFTPLLITFFFYCFLVARGHVTLQLEWHQTSLGRWPL
jgi:hypothetical protein